MMCLFSRPASLPCWSSSTSLSSSSFSPTRVDSGSTSATYGLQTPDIRQQQTTDDTDPYGSRNVEKRLEGGGGPDDPSVGRTSFEEAVRAISKALLAVHF